MAIAAPTYQLLLGMRDALPRGGKLLEIGEANWYGELDPMCLEELLDDPALMGDLLKAREHRDLFAIAKVFYKSLFAPSLMHAVDRNGTPEALRQDLNHPLRLAHSYDVVINHGTAEHIFNIAQVFRSIHDACKVGGLMIHDAPCYGWLDHGFYTLQPTLFYDLAAVNGYDLKGLAVYSIKSGEIHVIKSRDEIGKLSMPGDAMLFVVFGKDDDEPFRLPMQGYYGGELSEEGKRVWEEKR